MYFSIKIKISCSLEGIAYFIFFVDSIIVKHYDDTLIYNDYSVPNCRRIFLNRQIFLKKGNLYMNALFHLLTLTFTDMLIVELLEYEWNSLQITLSIGK